MSSFLAGRLLPAHLGDSLAALFLVTGAACILLHLLLGSIMAVFSLAVPALLTITAGVSPLAVGLLVYVLTVGQWFFPYQSLSLTIGLGEGEGGYSAGTASRFGLAYTVPSLLCGGAAMMSLSYDWHARMNFQTHPSGRRWIRTTEAISSRFTVCPLWPLGNSPNICVDKQ